MAAPCIAPQVEPPVEKKTMQVCEPKPKPEGRKQRVRDLLEKIFKGREEFLGWTPE